MSFYSKVNPRAYIMKNNMNNYNGDWWADSTKVVQIKIRDFNINPTYDEVLKCLEAFVYPQIDANPNKSVCIDLDGTIGFAYNYTAKFFMELKNRYGAEYLKRWIIVKSFNEPYLYYEIFSIIGPCGVKFATGNNSEKLKKLRKEKKKMAERKEKISIIVDKVVDFIIINMIKCFVSIYWLAIHFLTLFYSASHNQWNDFFIIIPAIILWFLNYHLYLKLVEPKLIKKQESGETYGNNFLLQ